MKTFTHSKPALLLAGLFIFGSSLQLVAQCNVNEKYDKIISGYHSSIALKDNGNYAVWGSAMKSDGNHDLWTPQDINATNYPGLTGTIYKAALGGSTSGAKKDQAILLTSDGLWAWGITGSVISSSTKSTATFGKVPAITNATALNMPAGVTPSDVQSLFATYQTLVLVTKIVAGVGGDVWILTQTSQVLEGNGGTGNVSGTPQWKRIKIDASTYLTNVVSARGQVTSGTLNAFIAQTSAGAVYTWGVSTFLGNSSVPASRSYATQMTLPQESGNIIPKMIGVTGGGSVKNTYYILSTTGNLYSLGDNTLKQCGDYAADTVLKKSWVRVKKSNAVNDYLADINTFSCQEHNSSYPAVGVVTNTGKIYTWGSDNSGLIGRTNDGTSTGTVGTSYDPGIPVDFTGTAVSIEVGGHTMLFLKTGSSQFCYVGHFTDGSMGDGDSTASASTVISPNCSSTPNISICGYVPIVASTVTSTISAASTSIAANGTSTTTITIQLKDGSGNNLTSSGGVVTVNTSAGTVGIVIDNNNGTYTVILTSAAAPASATISYSINGTASANTANVTFNSTLAVRWGNIFAFRQNHNLKIQWTTTQETNVSHYDIERSSNGRDWDISIPFIPANNLSTAFTYLLSDPDYTSERVYYRVKQTDMNGRYTYSPVATVAADNGIEKLVIYPVPVQNTFQMSNINPKDIKKVELITINGSYVRTWFSAQSSYDISNITRGMYIIKITTTDESAIFSKLTKQ